MSVGRRRQERSSGEKIVLSVLGVPRDGGTYIDRHYVGMP